jgi:hypothetical protein
MSTAELQEAVDKLSPEERTWLTRYLATLNRIHDPAFVTEVTRRNAEMAAGHVVARDEMFDRDAKLRAEGR